MEDIKALDIRTVNVPEIILEVSIILILFSYSFLVIYFFT